MNNFKVKEQFENMIANNERRLSWILFIQNWPKLIHWKLAECNTFVREIFHIKIS